MPSIENLYKSIHEDLRLYQQAINMVMDQQRRIMISLIQDTNKIIQRGKNNSEVREKLKNEPVTWSKVCCEEAAVTYDNAGVQGLSVEVSGIGPGSSEFRKWLSFELNNEGYGYVYIQPQC